MISRKKNVIPAWAVLDPQGNIREDGMPCLVICYAKSNAEALTLDKKDKIQRVYITFAKES
jgi:hypothetical protein